MTVHKTFTVINNKIYKIIEIKSRGPAGSTIINKYMEEVKSLKEILNEV